LLASVVAEMSEGSHIFLDAPLAQIPTGYGAKSFFLVSYSLKPSITPNLKLLASAVGERNRCQ